MTIPTLRAPNIHTLLLEADRLKKEQEEKKKALDLALSHIEKQYGSGAVMRLGEKPDANVEVMNLDNNQNEISRLKEQADSARKQQTDLDGIGKPEIHNSSDVNVARMDESTTDVTGKSEFVETKETEPVDKVGWIIRRIDRKSVV